MQICKPHWDMMRKSIDERGMSGLVAKSVDPLMSQNWHWTNEALRCGGLYVMTLKEDGTHYCPLCEFEAHAEGFVAQEAIDSVSDQMAAWCRSEGLLPKVS